MALVGDRERERAVAQLKRHYLGGRLSAEELAERVEVALAARRDPELRSALSELPSSSREHLIGACSALGTRVRRAAFVAAVWALWWLVSLVLAIGLVASIVVQGLSLATALVFPALWLGATLVARGVTRKPRPR
jgi:hypothetical protein